MKKFLDIFDDCTSLGTKIKTDEYALSGQYAIFDQGQDYIAGYTDKTEGVFKDVPVIIFGDHTRVIKYIDQPFFLGADGVKLLKAKPADANYKYLYYALRSVRIPNTGYNRHFKWLKEAQIQYPDADTQQKIVLVLEKAEALIQARKQQLLELDNLVKARFVEMFGSIHENKIYPYVKIKDLTTVTSGGTPSRECAEYWDGGEIGWVKTTELQNCELYNTEEKITELGMRNSSAKLVPQGTVLVAMYGQGKTRGMTAYLQFEATTNQACACILPSEQINSRYLWHYMMLSYEKLRDLAKGGNQPNLNGNMIKEFGVLLPPDKMQKEFVKFVAQVDKSKLICEKAAKI